MGFEAARVLNMDGRLGRFAVRLKRVFNTEGTEVGTQRTEVGAQRTQRRRNRSKEVMRRGMTIDGALNGARSSADG